MTKLCTGTYAVLISLLALGCSTTEGVPAAQEHGRVGKADHLGDICEMLDWYGDGVCDESCAEPDPDCSIDCRVAFIEPHCPGDREVLNELTCLTAGRECYSSTGLCGVKSLCMRETVCPFAGGAEAPACPFGMAETDACESENCQVVFGEGALCNDYVTCEPDAAHCTAIGFLPQCPPNQRLINAKTCDAAPDRCVTSTVSECGFKTHCLRLPGVCPEIIGKPAECPAGTTEVSLCETEDCQVVWGTGDACGEPAFCEP